MEEVKKPRVKIEKSNPSLQRIESRCINCGMCMQTCENIVGLDHTNEKENHPLCINCGQCIMNCPVGALCTKYDYKKVLNILNDTDKLVSVSLAPAVRVALGAEFGLEDGTNLEKYIPDLLRKLGFDYVFDITFGADVTIMEEASELVNRLTSKEKLPMFTSCCPSWVKYASMFHKELVPNLSTAKSPIGMQSTLIKTYFKEMNEIDKDIISVVIAPCTAKKYEIENTDTDYILTTSEFAMMLRECEIDTDNLKESEFDKLLSRGSKSGLMFGRSGGVMESALNYAYFLMTGKNPKEGMFHMDIDNPITTKTYKIGNKNIDIAVVYGMKNLEELLKEKDNYDFIEVMNCPLGCVGGGGQPLIPIQKLDESRKERLNSLNSDANEILYCYQNPEIIDLYKSYIGKPLNDKAHKLLHTNYNNLPKK